MLTYFAYGSNLLDARLVARTPGARFFTTGSLWGHRLEFHKIGDDQSGKCDAYHTGRTHDVVFGALYHLPPEEKPFLDAVEGLGAGYEIKPVTVVSEMGLVAAFTYVVQPEYRDPEMVPFHWYKAFVVTGAIQRGFPRDYVRRLLERPGQDDLDSDRHRRNQDLIQNRHPELWTGYQDFLKSGY